MAPRKPIAINALVAFSIFINPILTFAMDRDEPIPGNTTSTTPPAAAAPAPAPPLFADDITALTWVQLVENFIHEFNHKPGPAPHRDASHLTRMQRIGLRFGIVGAVDTIQDIAEVRLQQDVITGLRRLTDLVNPVQHIFDPASIRLAQDALIPQLYRLARFRYGINFEYLNLAKKVAASIATSTKAPKAGPLTLNLEGAITSLPPVARETLHGWLEYVTNGPYLLRSTADIATISGGIVFLLNNDKRYLLERSLNIFLTAPHVRQLEYYLYGRPHRFPYLEWGAPYLIHPQNLSEETPYQPHIADFVMSGSLSTVITAGQRSALQAQLQKLMFALEYHKIAEIMRCILKPMEEIAQAPIDGGGMLTPEEQKFTLSCLYFLGGVILHGLLPKTLLQAEPSGAPRNALELYYRLIPFKDLRNIGLITHNHRRLNRPQDQGFLIQHLPQLASAMRLLAPHMRRLIEFEMDGVLGRPTALDGLDLAALRTELADPLTEVKLVGDYGSDVASIHKIAQSFKPALIGSMRGQALNLWTPNMKTAFIRLLAILGECSKNLSLHVQGFVAPEGVWRILTDIRDGLIHNRPKAGEFARAKLEPYLEDDSHTLVTHAALDAIMEIVGRLQALYEHAGFSIDTIPTPLTPPTAHAHITHFYDAIRNFVVAPPPAAPFLGHGVAAADLYEAATPATFETLRATFEEHNASLILELDQVRAAVTTHDLARWAAVNAILDGIPLSNRERGLITAVRVNLEAVRGQVAPITTAIADEPSIADADRAFLATFVTPEGTFAEADITNATRIMAELPQTTTENIFDPDEVSYIDHQLIEMLQQFIAKKKAWLLSHEPAFNVLCEYKLKKQFISLLHELIDDEELKEALEANTNEQNPDELEENEKQIREILKAHLAGSQLQKYGIKTVDDIEAWVFELKKHHGLILKPKGQALKTLMRAKRAATELLGAFADIEKLTTGIDALTRGERASMSTEGFERYQADDVLCLTIEDTLETLRHMVGGLLSAAQPLQAIHPAMAQFIQNSLSAFQKLGNEIGHVADAMEYETETERGQRYSYLIALRGILGELVGTRTISLMDVVRQFLQLINPFLSDPSLLFDSSLLFEAALNPAAEQVYTTADGGAAGAGAAPTRFRVERVAEDGDCGFTALGLTRNQAVQQLIENQANPAIRAAVADDIRQALLQQNLPLGMRGREIYHLWAPQFYHLQTQIDGIRRTLDDVDLARATPEAIVHYTPDVADYDEARATRIRTYLGLLARQTDLNIRIDAFTNNEDTYRQFVLHEFGRGAWLTYVRDGRGTLYALARINHINAHIWHLNPTGQLEPIPLARGLDEGATREVHMLHTNGLTHFNRLVHVEGDAPLAVEAADGGVAETKGNPAPSVPTATTPPPVAWADVSYNFAPTDVGGGVSQGGASLSLSPYSTLGVRMENSDGGFRICYADQWAQCGFSPTIIGGALSIVAYIVSQTASTRSFPRKGGMTLFFK
ncbi:MAG: hypothetical protein J0G29_04105 [Alphaproteobacteria bacterium]|nr:hypothetical protein [Alphaproteobacteria bacterium]OJV46824.1 MAG: hypothetical protein BGO28_04275 [Alphaproteobacteria bacterium 43-37]